MILSACGLICDECEYFPLTCHGCHEVEGSTFWAKEMMPNKICPLYDCGVNHRGYKDCGECAELPCKIFREMKDPDTSDEEHLHMLEVRVNSLKGS